MFLIFLALISHGILNENHEYEYAAYGLIIASLLIFGVLTLFESYRDSKSSVFKFKKVLEEDMSDFCLRVNQKCPLVWSFNAHKMQLEITFDQEIVKLSNRMKTLTTI